MRKFLTASLVILGAAYTSALGAQPLPRESINPAKIIPYFNVDTIDATLKTVTGNHLPTVSPTGENIVTAYAPNGLQFTIHFQLCEGKVPVQCKAIQLLTSWDLENRKVELQKLIPQFQRNHLFVSSGLLEDGRPYISRIVIADQGLAQGNLATEIRNFISDATEFNSQLSK